jgi:hypothetical protein
MSKGYSALKDLDVSSCICVYLDVLRRSFTFPFFPFFLFKKKEGLCSFKSKTRASRRRTSPFRHGAFEVSLAFARTV